MAKNWHIPDSDKLLVVPVQNMFLFGIRRIQAQKGETIKNICKELKISPQFYQLIRRRERYPHVLTLVNIARILGIDFYELAKLTKEDSRSIFK